MPIKFTLNSQPRALDVDPAMPLLASNAKPNDADIDSAMSGNICRCATYVRIRAAIHEAAESLPATAGF
jgi:aerobic-type carbon monoxide dehydrogenase small subunit (CoxS/CutS family)